ncbi:MAG: hypothetical protein HC930_03600 [Hydrococcus sp. SU_1_0]|nr:hypothetical protein [Hydrococcus sp. SU_1_0]
MSDREAEDLSPELTDFSSDRSMEHFALALKQRRTLEREQLQFARAIEAKYPGNKATEPSTATVINLLQQGIGCRSDRSKSSL